MLCYVRYSLKSHLQKASGSLLFSVFNLSILSLLNWLLLLTLFCYNYYHFHPTSSLSTISTSSNSSTTSPCLTRLTTPIPPSPALVVTTRLSFQICKVRWSHPIQQPTFSMLTGIPRFQCRPSSNNTSPRHHSQPGRSDLRRDKNIRLGQATLEVNNFSSTFNSGPTKSISPSIYTQQQTIPLAGMHTAVAGWMKSKHGVIDSTSARLRRPKVRRWSTNKLIVLDPGSLSTFSTSFNLDGHRHLESRSASLYSPPDYASSPSSFPRIMLHNSQPGSGLELGPSFILFSSPHFVLLLMMHYCILWVSDFCAGVCFVCFLHSFIFFTVLALTMYGGDCCFLSLRTDPPPFSFHPHFPCYSSAVFPFLPLLQTYTKPNFMPCSCPLVYHPRLFLFGW